MKKGFGLPVVHRILLPMWLLEEDRARGRKFWSHFYFRLVRASPGRTFPFLDQTPTSLLAFSLSRFSKTQENS